MTDVLVTGPGGFIRRKATQISFGERSSSSGETLHSPRTDLHFNSW